MRGVLGRGVAVAGIAAAAAMLFAPTAGATGFRDTFNSGAEGWRAACCGGPIDWLSSGGNPGGYIGEAGCGQGTFAGAWSPPAWAGDRSSAYGGVLSFDATMDAGRTGVLHVRLDSADPDSVSMGTGACHLTDEWRHFSVPLRATPDWDSTEGPVTKILFIDVLSDLDFAILGVELETAFTAAYFDNITFAANVRRRLTIKQVNRGFAGKLKPAGKCARGQKVVVRRKRNGADPKVGSDRTDSQGNYLVREPDPANGAYYAQAGKSFETGIGNCLAAKSKTATVTG
jgi:hypothetical protein